MLESANEILEKKMRGQIESRPENNNTPVGEFGSRSGGEGEYKTFRSPEGARLSSACPTAMSTSEEADALDLGEGLDVEGSVVLEKSMLPCIAQVVTGPGRMEGMWGRSVVI